MADIKKIKCPYCFKTFSHEDVLFRSATAFNEVDLDPTEMGRSKDDILLDFNLSDEEKEHIIRQ